jgi:hypothetical protein
MDLKLPQPDDMRIWMIGGVSACLLFIALPLFLMQSPQADQATPTPTINIILATPTTTPHITPIRRTPTPTPTPTPTQTPQPTPKPRYCETNFITNETVCYEGIAPTPTPEPTASPVPTPSPTPVPNWVKAGLVCAVPDRLLSLPWIDAYKYPCTCAVRAEFQLGQDFSPFEGCHSQGAWRDASCNCVEIICTKERGLC